LSGEQLDCRNCHDPHASAGVGLIFENSHSPFSDNSCDVCHPGTDNDKEER
jgi:hypothetical protein